MDTNEDFQKTAREIRKYQERKKLKDNHVKYEGRLSNKDVKAIKAVCEKELPLYWQPKRYIPVETLPLTGTGKPDRATARQIAKK